VQIPIGSFQLTQSEIIHKEIHRYMELTSQTICETARESLILFIKSLMKMIPHLPLIPSYRALELLIKKNVSGFKLARFIKDSYSVFEKEKLIVKEILLDYYEDVEIKGWKGVSLIFRVCSNDYRKLLEIWSKISKSKPEELRDLFVEVEPC